MTLQVRQFCNSLKEKTLKYQENVKTFLKQSVFHDNPKTLLLLLHDFVLNCHVASLFLKSPSLGKLRFPISCCQIGFGVLNVANKTKQKTVSQHV